MHSDAYLRHFREPHGQGSLADATYTATVTDPACGDELALDLEVRDGRIVGARFRVRGCSGAIAAGSALVTLLPGRAAEAGAVTREDLDRELGGVARATRVLGNLDPLAGLQTSTPEHGIALLDRDRRVVALP